MTKIDNKQKIYLFFFLLLSLEYLFPLVIFGKITLFYHDALDSEIVYNSVLGKIYAGNLDSLKLFLNEEIKIEYLRRLFQPISVFYYLFNPELAYWLIDILFKATSFLSFYILAKKINNVFFVCVLVAGLFASLNDISVQGLGIAIMPYIIYLISFKRNLVFKHFVIISFFGLNTDLTSCVPQILALIILSYILHIGERKKFIFKLFLVLSIFMFFIFISNLNLIYGQLRFNDSHRLSFVYESIPLLNNFFLTLKGMIKIPNDFNWTLIKLFPEFTIYTIILILSFFKIDKKISQILLLLFSINFVNFFTNTEIVTSIRNASNGLFKTFHIEYITFFNLLLFPLLLLLILKKHLKFKREFIFCFIFLILIKQISPSITPLVKKYYLKELDYRNIYTFSGYYMFKDYSKIKELVKNKKVISVGYDPMIAVMNDIHAIDGYHNMYPLSYKIKFREIINKELKKNSELKKNYDDWGSRVYASFSDSNNIELNFLKAKNLGADFVISKHEIKSSEIDLIENKFKNKIFLYKIN